MLSFFDSVISFILNSFFKLVLNLFFARKISRKRNTKQKTTLSDGYLGSRNDEERSEMRYVMRIAELSESSNL
jgi:hypothetical protein